MKRILLLAPMCAMIAVTAEGQEVTKVGTTSAKFLSIAVGARALGMGGAFVAVADDASGMYWNPSGIARLNTSEAVFSHADWIADIDFNYGAVAIPVEGLGTFGLNFTSMTTNDMERTTVTQPEGTGEMFSVGSYAIGIAYARNLTEWFSIGVNAKYISEHIWNSGASGFAIDIGTLFTTPFPGLKFGAGIANFGTKMKIDGDDLIVLQDISQNNGNNGNINAHLSTDNFDIPLTLRIGFAYEPIVDESNHLTIVIDALHPNDNSESINIGAEYQFLDNILSLRGGYKGLGTRDRQEEFTVGGGARYEIVPGLIARFDYAFLKFGLLSNVNVFSLGVQF